MVSRVGVADETEHNVGYRSKLRPEVMKLSPPLRAGLRMLDVGCGDGVFSAAFPQAAETWGIEPDQRSAAVAVGSMTKVFPNTFEEVEFELPAGYFDLVVCNDVMEHMTDHDSFLRRIQRVMAPGAYLVGPLPNARFRSNLFNLVVARDWHYQDSGVLDRTHFRFFTFKSLRRTLGEAGFEVKRIEGLNGGGVSGWGARDVAERAFGAALLLLSGGAAADISYLQIGFLAVPIAAH